MLVLQLSDLIMDYVHIGNPVKNNIIPNGIFYHINYTTHYFSLNTIYETYLYQCFEFNSLRDINYFKNFFTIITKLIIYRYISKYFNVLIKRNIKAEQIDYNEYYKWLSNYKYIIKLIKEKNKEFIKFI